MATLWTVVYFLLWLFFVALIGRMVIGWVEMLSRDFRPRGVLLVIAEALFTVTDPPVKLLRRLIPPVRIGGMALDVGVMALFMGTWILMSLAASLAA